MHRTFWTLCAIFYLFAVIAHAQEEPPVGWFFTPSDSPQAGNELAAKTGASVLAIIAGGWSMEPAEGQFDFTPIDRHIEYAEKHGLKLGMICEVNPLFAPKWLQEKCKAAGQASLETRGDVLVQPALASPIFLKAQDELIRRVVEYVQQRDTNHVIEYYYPGAEWWFWDPTRYNEWDYDTFRAWLKSRYGTLEKLNRTWQAEYTSFDQISPPSVGFDQFGKSDGLSPWSQLGRTQAWVCDQPIPIKPRTKYTLSAWVKVRDAQGKGAFLSLELLPESDTNSLRLMESSYGQRDTNDWHKITWSLITQDWSTRARLRLNLSGTGLVDYDNVVFCEDGTTENLVPNGDFEQGNGLPAGWHFEGLPEANALRGVYLRNGILNGSAGLRITVPENDYPTSPFKNLDAAVYDWQTCWEETGAMFINECSRRFKQLDPTRKTVTYLTYAFAWPAEWDYTQTNAIAPALTGIHGKDIDQFGLQICSAEKDPYRVTANLDLMRKYRKPLWAVDLIDFTSGVKVGIGAMEKATQAAIQHGAKGIIYCGWHMDPVPDYSYYPNFEVTDMMRMLTDAREAIKHVDDMRVKARTAIVVPRMPASPLDAPGYKNDFRSFMGWYKILENMHLTADVVTLQEIERGEARLNGYQWVLIPDCAYLPKKALDQLATYASQGGRIISGGRFAQFDETATPLSAEAAEAVLRTDLPDYGRRYAGHLIRATYGGNTPPLFIWRTETPENAAIYRKAQVALRKQLGKATLDSIPQLIPDEPALRCVMYEGADSQGIYIVNMLEDTVKAGQYRLRLKTTAKGGIQAWADGQQVQIADHGKDNEVLIHLPAFRTACILKLKKSE